MNKFVTKTTKNCLYLTLLIKTSKISLIKSSMKILWREGDCIRRTRINILVRNCRARDWKSTWIRSRKCFRSTCRMKPQIGRLMTRNSNFTNRVIFFRTTHATWMTQIIRTKTVSVSREVWVCSDRRQKTRQFWAWKIRYQRKLTHKYKS